MPITNEIIASKFNHFRDNIFKGAKVTCTYHGQTFEGTRVSIERDQAASVYGIADEYEFSIYARVSSITSNVRDNERLTVTNAEVAGEPTEMRVMGIHMDGVAAVIRLDLKGLNE